MSKSKPILLVSTKAGSGKSVIAIGMFLKFKEEGLKPGYFKAIGDAMDLRPKTKTDKDVNVITAVVARQFSKEEMCPQFLNPSFFLDEILPEESQQVLDKIKDHFESMKNKTDIIILEGNHNVNQYSAIYLDDTVIAKEFDANVILCAPIKDDDDLNTVIAAYNYLKLKDVKVIGVILNGLSDTAYVRIEKYHKPLLGKLGISVIGGLKKSRQLEKPTVAEILEAVQGELISGNYVKVKNNLIDGFIIGAMGAESAASYLRKGVNQCVITGGDRPDIALAALDASTNLIIFSGNIRPAPRVISVAEEKGIPLALAPGDTFTISEQIRKIHTHIQPNEIGICKEQVEKYIDWDKIPK